MPMRPYHRFVVRGVVALCEQGQPIPPDSLTEIAAVCHETTDNDDDPNISAFGVYGVLFDQSVDSMLIAQRGRLPTRSPKHSTNSTGRKQHEPLANPLRALRHGPREGAVHHEQIQPRHDLHGLQDA